MVYWIQSLQWIPLTFFTNPSEIVVLCHIHPLFRLFPHSIACRKPITTFSVSNLQIIPTSPEVKVFQKPFQSTTCTPGISETQTHLITNIHTTHIWCTGHLIPVSNWMQWLLPESQSAFDCWINWPFSRPTTSSTHSCSNGLWILLRIVLTLNCNYVNLEPPHNPPLALDSLLHLSLYSYHPQCLLLVVLRWAEQMGTYIGTPENQSDVSHFTEKRTLGQIHMCDISSILCLPLKLTLVE